MAATPDGRLRFDVVLGTRGLPDPESLGPYAAYVAWVASPLLYPIYRLGEVPPEGVAELGQIAMNKFLLLVSAEPRPEVAEPTGPFVLRAQSPSSRMQPADFLEFMLGAVAVEEEHRGHAAEGDVARGEGPTGRAAGDPDAPPSWEGIPMPERLMMLPSLMALRPRATPWLPREDAARGPIVDARPREIVRLSDGDALALAAVPVRARVGNRTVLGYGFNGQVPGPLLWIPQGATVTIDFTNRIEWPTAIHWHGVRLDNRFDGVPGVTQEPIPPGGSYRYRVHFRDAGIYWYHPHHREDVQQDLGLYGNLMVRSPRPDYFGPANREEILMLDDLLLGVRGLVPYGRETATHALMGRFGNVLLVNGEPAGIAGARGWSIDVRRGAVLRFFLTNVSSTRTFNLSFGGAPMKLIGTDVGKFEREEWVESVVLAPAERYIIHVRFAESGTVPLLNRVQAIDHLGGRFFAEEDTLGIVRVGTEPARPDLRESFEALRRHEHVVEELDRFRPLFTGPPDRRLELDMRARDLPLVVERLMQLDSAYFHPLEWSGTMPMMNLMATPEEVEWVLRDPDTGAENEAIAWRFRVGDVVRLRITNRRETLHAMQHPIHIHGQRFLVLAVNGVANDNLAWKDTAVVPVGSTVDLLLELSNPGR
ncbi:MAG: multicopper oxidase family protein, partial [Gemmatimonadota bacterium]